MTLINCPECKNPISDKAKVCPNCGFPLEEKDCGENKMSGTDPADLQNELLKQKLLDDEKRKILNRIFPKR